MQLKVRFAFTVYAHFYWNWNPRYLATDGCENEYSRSGYYHSRL